jgi:hypothetical protein
LPCQLELKFHGRYIGSILKSLKGLKRFGLKRLASGGGFKIVATLSDQWQYSALNAIFREGGHGKIYESISANRTIIGTDHSDGDAGGLRAGRPCAVAGEGEEWERLD